MIGTKTPKALQNAVFFIVGKMFSLRGGVELRELKPSQVRRHIPILTNMFTPRMCRRLAVEPLRNCMSPTRLFRCLGVLKQERCPVYVLDMYYSKLPKQGLVKDIFLFQPLTNVPTNFTSPWYSGSQPIGKNTLDYKLSRMCALAGIEGRITNHSLGATSATQMHEMGVPEKVIQERTGHRSLEALCVYERSNAHQQEAASSVLSNLQVRTYSEQHGFARHHSQTVSTSIGVPQPSNTFQGLPISFGNLYGCATTPVQTLHHLSHLSTLLKPSWTNSSQTSRLTTCKLQPENL